MLKFLAAGAFTVSGGGTGIPTSTKTVGAGLVNILQVLISVVGMLAIVFIIVAGIQMSLSAGNPSRFAKARETLLYAVVGIVTSIAALAAVTFVANSVKGGH